MSPSVTTSTSPGSYDKYPGYQEAGYHGTMSTMSAMSGMSAMRYSGYPDNLVSAAKSEYPGMESKPIITELKYHCLLLTKVYYLASIIFCRSVWPVSVWGLGGATSGSWVSPSDGSLPRGSSCPSCPSCRHSCWTGPSCGSCPVHGGASWIWCLQRKVHALLFTFVYFLYIFNSLTKNKGEQQSQDFLQSN